MTSNSSANSTNLWQFDAALAKLSSPCLCGKVTLDEPAAGIGRLAWKGKPLTGSVLGVSAGTDSKPQDVFVRGADLVATYVVQQPHNFSWQIYWRVQLRDRDVVLIDAILSLQTALLENFPVVSTNSQLTADNSWLVEPNGESQRISHENLIEEPTEDCHCVVLRSSGGSWSYAEMTHPLDQGKWCLIRSETGQTSVQRQLGGCFLEKGVIRRLRLRGAFLPRENDLSQAAELFADLAAETPPLTV